MKVEMLLEKVEHLAKKYPGLEINEIKFDDVEVVIDLDVDSFRRIDRKSTRLNSSHAD